MLRYLRYGMFFLVCGCCFISAACTSSTPADVVTTLYPVQWATNEAFGVDGCGTSGLDDGLGAYLPPDGDASTSDPKFAQVVAGYNDYNREGCRNNSVYRGAFRFAIPSGTTITRAILHFRTTHYYYLTVDPFEVRLDNSRPYSCVASLQVGEADWTTGSYDISPALIPSAAYYPLPSGDLGAMHDALSNPSGVSVQGVDEAHAGFGFPTGAYFAVNATGQITEWAGEDPGQNHGFILVSRSEDLGTGMNEACASFFDQISLEIHSPGLFPSDKSLPIKVGATPTTIPTAAPTPTLPSKPTPTATPLPAPTATPKPSGAAHLEVSPTQTTGFCLNGQYPPVTVRNTGNAPLQWSVTSSVALTVAPSQGILAPDGTQVVQVSGSPPQPVSSVVLTFTSNGGTGTITFTCK